VCVYKSLFNGYRKHRFERFGSIDFSSNKHWKPLAKQSGNTKGGSTTLPLTSCLTGLESAV
jgi:hypothetical protein